MRHRKDTFKLGMPPSHRNALVANQVASLIISGEIRTTLEKAKGVRRVAERMITLAKKGDLHHRRIAIAKIHDNEAVSKLFAEIAPKFANREGGYTRIIKLGKRRGDAAEICLLQLVEQEALQRKPKKKTEKSKSEIVAEKEQNAEKNQEAIDIEQAVRPEPLQETASIG